MFEILTGRRATGRDAAWKKQRRNPIGRPVQYGLGDFAGPDDGRQSHVVDKDSNSRR